MTDELNHQNAILVRTLEDILSLVGGKPEVAQSPEHILSEVYRYIRQTQKQNERGHKALEALEELRSVANDRSICDADVRRVVVTRTGCSNHKWVEVGESGCPLVVCEHCGMDVMDYINEERDDR